MEIEPVIIHMTEDPEQDLTADLKYIPTQEQLSIGYKNMNLVFNKNGKTSAEDFNKVIELPEFKFSRIVMTSFILNTCELFFEDKTATENMDMVALACQYNNNAHNTEQWMELNVYMFEVICEPVPLIENYKFLECWNVLLQAAFIWKMKIYCEGTGRKLLMQIRDLNDEINVEEFPFNIQL